MSQKFSEKERRIACYDDGKSGDRYTVAFLGFPENPVIFGRKRVLKKTYNCLAMSGAPFHPQGVGMHSSAVLGRHLGKRIPFTALPADCRKLVRQDLEWQEPIDTFKARHANKSQKRNI